MAATIRAVAPADRAEWLHLRGRLWPEEPPGALKSALDGYLSSVERGSPTLEGLPARVFVAVAPDGGLVGLLEASLRPFADGCDSRPVGYLEGWYVAPEVRRQGIGAALVRAAEAWARDQGCVELASDALLSNLEGQAAHRALGFDEVERAVRYRRSLAGSGRRTPAP